MFGFIIPNYDNLPENEKSRYQSVYCGLCHSLRDNYSQVSRLALSYDLTFLVLLLSSLYEPKETSNFCNCIFHPGEKFKTAQNKYSEYCADLTIILAYHKILDDIEDEASLKAKISKRALNEHYITAKEKQPEICKTVEKYMNLIKMFEQENRSGDDVAKAFGMILGSMFAKENDVFYNNLQAFGANLGRFIYFMDAAIDLEKDIKTNNYNPFKKYLKGSTTINLDTAKQIKENLSNFAGMALKYFEMLPLQQDLHLLQNILYEGM